MLSRSIRSAAQLARLSGQQMSSRQVSTTTRLLGSIRPLGPKDAVPNFKGTAVVDGDFKVSMDMLLQYRSPRRYHLSVRIDGFIPCS